MPCIAASPAVIQTEDHEAQLWALAVDPRSQWRARRLLRSFPEATDEYSSEDLAMQATIVLLENRGALLASRYTPAAHHFFAMRQLCRRSARQAQVRRRRAQMLAAPEATDDRDNQCPEPTTALWRAIEALSETLHHVFVQRYVHERPCRELAAEYAVSPRTISTWCNRARWRLRAIIPWEEPLRRVAMPRGGRYQPCQ